jgi:hypothetical protein
MSQAGLISGTPGKGSITGVASTVGAANANIVSLPLGAVPGTYTFDIFISAFNAATPAGAGYAIVASVRTTGAAAVLIPNQAIDEFEEAVLIPADAQVTVAGNNAIIQVTGAAGLTINWSAVADYIFVS